MSLRTLLSLAALVAAAATLSPSPAQAAPPTGGLPLVGAGAGTITLNLATGTATADGGGQMTHLGAFTGHVDLQFAFSGSSFTYTGTGTDVAANGDRLIFSVRASGTVGGSDTETDTITGGTGRFAGASGSFTETVHLLPISATSTTLTNGFTFTINGEIGY